MGQIENLQMVENAHEYFSNLSPTMGMSISYAIFQHNYSQLDSIALPQAVYNLSLNTMHIEANTFSIISTLLLNESRFTFIYIFIETNTHVDINIHTYLLDGNYPLV